MERLTLEKAKELNARMVTEEHLILHAANVSAAMEAMAGHFGADPEHWAAVGWLHDYDYEHFPEEHLAHTEVPLREAGVPEEDIFMDHAGFSTYDSIYRADAIFCVSRAIVVSQKDHLYRALYGCKKIGIEAKGVPAEGYEKYSQYYGHEYNIREYLARAKDFVKWIIKPEPKYLGDKIPIDGDGRQTEGD